MISVLDFKISCLEIYQEHVFDLFADEKGMVIAENIHTTSFFWISYYLYRATTLAS